MGVRTKADQIPVQLDQEPIEDLQPVEPVVLEVVPVASTIEEFEVIGVPETLTNQKSVSIQVSGKEFSFYRIFHGQFATDCNGVNYSAWKILTEVTAVSSAEGANHICIQFKSPAGAVFPDFKKYTWITDTTPPVPVLGNLPASVGAVPTYSFSVSGTDVFEYAASLTSSGTCSLEDLVNWKSASVLHSGVTAKRVNKLCVIARDQAGNVQVLPTEYDWSISINPSFSGSGLHTATEDATSVVSQQELKIETFDYQPGEVAITITAGPVRGYLKFDDVSIPSFPMAITQADINAGRLSYRHTGRAESDEFKFTAADPSGSVSETTLTINVIPRCRDDLLTNTPFADGTGVPADPYVICTPAQFNAIAASPAWMGSDFVLFNDLDFTALALVPAGASSDPFAGTFDGRKYVVKNVNYSAPASDAGLFSFIDGGVLSNFTFENVIISCPFGSRCGTLVGTFEGGQIVNASGVGSVTGVSEIGGLVGTAKGLILNSVFHATADIAASGDSVGGMVGLAQGATFTGSSISSDSGVKVRGSTDVGGFAGVIDAGTVATRLSAAIDVQSSKWIAGGLVGTAVASSIIESFATGAVSQTLTGHCALIGGLTGVLSTGSVTMRSFATGAVTAAGAGAGGFVGWIEITATVDDSYATGAVTAKRTNTAVGVNGCTTTPTAAYAGGFSGVMAGGGTISRSYATGSANGTDGNENGGFIGMAIQQGYSWVTVNNFSTGASFGAGTNNGFLGRRANGTGETGSYWDLFLSGRSVMCGTISGGGCSDARGIDTSILANIGYFFNKTNLPLSTWNFTTVWRERVGDYPILRWQN